MWVLPLAWSATYNAAEDVVRELVSQFPDTKGGYTIVLCGGKVNGKPRWGYSVSTTLWGYK